MKTLRKHTFRMRIPLASLAFPALAAAQGVTMPAPEPLPDPPDTIYRQILPDGRVLYSDKLAKGARVDEKLLVEPAGKGSTWSVSGGTPPKMAPQSRQTDVRQVNVVPAPGEKPTRIDAESNVIRAEMLLEEARKRREAGIEPQPGERTGTTSGYTRLNEQYAARQQALQQAVDEAEQALRRAVAERDAMSSAR